ncbi:MAG: glycosyltransferase family 4 protein [Salinivirgaceae bacterium]|nr:glycosyltransferase family 4 protein [Salinivirgaceae bacterium]
MNKPKVLLIQELLQNYRAPIYSLMREKVDLTLAYTTRNDIEDTSFNIIQLPYFKLGKLIIHKNLYKILNQYDVVVSQPHLSSVRLCMLQWLPRKFKLVTWSIGKHVSYNAPFDLTKRPTFTDWIFEIIQDGADACIFYMKETIDYWTKYKKINKQKYFEAHNTVAVAEFKELPDFKSRSTFLFVGTLYAQKGLGELIDAYRMAIKRCPNLPVLKIVGKGPEKEKIVAQIKKSGLENKIILCGPIYDEIVLKDYFLEAVLCISPKQAGLSVPKSLGYGCPFVTRPDAITGGERDNVKHGYNGLFYNSLEELTEILIDVTENKRKYSVMSINAREYYIEQCSPEFMSNGALAAINYAMSSNE